MKAFYHLREWPWFVSFRVSQLIYIPATEATSSEKPTAHIGAFYLEQSPLTILKVTAAERQEAADES